MLKKIIILLMAGLIFTSNVNAKTIEIKIPEEIIKNNDEEIPRNTIEDDFLALQKIAIAEAGCTNADMMADIMYTILNRVESDLFPNTVYEVISQKNQFTTYPDKYNKAIPNEQSKEALNLILNGKKNRGQLFFENPKLGSWISTNRTFIFSDYDVYFYQ